jgi:hypothetical protein
MPKKPIDGETEPNDSLAQDQKERGYYYDDSHGYEDYDPENEDGESEDREQETGDKRQETEARDGRQESGDKRRGSHVSRPA